MEYVRIIQKLLNKLGAQPKLAEDDKWGAKTEAALNKEIGEQPKPITLTSTNPAYAEAKKYAGKKESDPAFNKWMSAFWAKAGLPGYKTIVGTSFAWCGLFVLAMNSESGLKYINGAAGAKNWAKYGQSINWKQDGIPRGAVMHLNHKGVCSGPSSGNHVTFADGDCTAADLKKSGATVPGFGGNQGNTVKRSNYVIKEVCEVRWPSEIPLPPPVTKSVDCSGSATGDSTR